MAGDMQFKTSLFGFDRKAVAEYIESTAKRASILKNEKDKLDIRCSSLEKELANKNAELEKLRSEDNGGKLAELEERASVAELKAARLENELKALNAKISEFKEKAAIYDTAKDRIAGLELDASRRAVEIEREAERRAAEIASNCSAYIASVKAKYIKVSDDTRQSSEMIISEMNRLSDRLSVLSALLGDRADAFDFLEPFDKNGNYGGDVLPDLPSPEKSLSSDIYQ
jgi:chromosome segregation ATPase